MLDNWTKDDFFIKVQNEGGYEGMYHYCGRVAIIDAPDLEKAWDQFCRAMDELEIEFNVWEPE